MIEELSPAPQYFPIQYYPPIYFQLINLYLTNELRQSAFIAPASWSQGVPFYINRTK